MRWLSLQNGAHVLKSAVSRTTLSCSKSGTPSISPSSLIHRVPSPASRYRVSTPKLRHAKVHPPGSAASSRTRRHSPARSRSCSSFGRTSSEPMRSRTPFRRRLVVCASSASSRSSSSAACSSRQSEKRYRIRSRHAPADPTRTADEAGFSVMPSSSKKRATCAGGAAMGVAPRVRTPPRCPIGSRETSRPLQKDDGRNPGPGRGGRGGRGGRDATFGGGGGGGRGRDHGNQSPQFAQAEAQS